MFKLLCILFTLVNSKCYTKQDYINDCVDSELNYYTRVNYIPDLYIIKSFCKAQYRIDSIINCNAYCDDLNTLNDECVNYCVDIYNDLNITKINSHADDCMPLYKN